MAGNINRCETCIGPIRAHCDDAFADCAKFLTDSVIAYANAPTSNSEADIDLLKALNLEVYAVFQNKLNQTLRCQLNKPEVNERLDTEIQLETWKGNPASET